MHIYHTTVCFLREMKIEIICLRTLLTQWIFSFMGNLVIVIFSAPPGIIFPCLVSQYL